MKEHSSELKEHVIKKKGTTYITNEGLKLIKIYMGLIQVPTIQENEISIDNIVQEIKEGLKEDLMEEIQANNLIIQKDYQEKLSEMEMKLKKLQELKTQNKKLIDSIGLLNETKNEEGFFKRLFKKKQ